RARFRRQHRAFPPDREGVRRGELLAGRRGAEVEPHPGIGAVADALLALEPAPTEVPAADAVRVAPSRRRGTGAADHFGLRAPATPWQRTQYCLYSCSPVLGSAGSAAGAVNNTAATATR